MFVHPIKVAIVEALIWVDEPLSASLIERLMDDGTTLPLISYHMRTLAGVGIVVNVKEEPVRGAVQTYYRLQPASTFWIASPR
jgi:hypothetical protein